MALPIFNFPSTVVIVDDDTVFLESLSAVLSQYYKVKTFESPELALEFFSNYSSPLSQVPLLRGVKEYEDYDAQDKAIIQLDFNKLLDIANMSIRDDEVSVLIADFSMPNMTGVEMCKKLGNSFKRILLTAYDESITAINALNNGWIDCYIGKDTINKNNLLLNYVHDLVRRHFIGAGANIRLYLETEDLLPLSSDNFSDFFTTWAKRNNVKEFYLTDKNGSMLLIDKDNKQSTFIIHTDKSLNNFTRLFDSSKEFASFIADVRNRTKIPVFDINTLPETIAPENWRQYLVEPNIFNVANKRYYWVHVNK